MENVIQVSDGKHNSAWIYSSSVLSPEDGNLDQLSFEPPPCLCGGAYVAVVQYSVAGVWLECCVGHHVFVTPGHGRVVPAGVIPVTVEIRAVLP